MSGRQIDWLPLLTPGELDPTQKQVYDRMMQDVDAATYAQAKAEFGDNGLVDIVMLTGLYLVTCAALNAVEVPVP